MCAENDNNIIHFPMPKLPSKQIGDTLFINFSDMDIFIEVVNMMAEFTYDENIPEIVRRKYLNKLKKILLMESEDF